MSSVVLDSESVRKRFENVIDVLRYHVATGRFSYVDRIMAAMSPSVVEETVREAVRAVISAASSPRVTRGNPVEYSEEKKGWEVKQGEIEVEYVEEERISPREGGRLVVPARARLHGRLLKVGEEWKILYTPPRLPSDSELAEFFDEVRRNLDVAKLVASLAMTFPTRR